MRMSLDNLVKIGKLHRHAPQRDEIQRLLRGLERNLADAQVKALSDEGRFAAAYDALLRIATIALRSSGYRTSVDQPGHHAITLQALPLTLGIDADLTIQLDAFRRKRNRAAYEGDDSVSATEVDELLAIVAALKQQLIAWLTTKHPDLL
jgi:hypothetical protein